MARIEKLGEGANWHVYAHPRIASEANDYLDKQGIKGLYSDWRTFNNWWKRAATTYWRGFHIRNLMGGWFNNTICGVGQERYKFAFKMLFAMADEVMPEELYRARGLQRATGHEWHKGYTWGHYREFANSAGIGPMHARGVEDVYHENELLMKRMNDGLTPPGRLRRGLHWWQTKALSWNATNESLLRFTGKHFHRPALLLPFQTVCAMRFRVCSGGLISGLLPTLPNEGKTQTAGTYQVYLKLLVVADLVDEIKNISGIISAYSMAGLKNNSELIIVGEGADKAKLMELAGKNKLAGKKITFKGRLNNAAVLDEMKSADFLVINSRFETFSIVAAEALLSGIPVVSSKCGVPEEFLNSSASRASTRVALPGLARMPASLAPGG